MTERETGLSAGVSRCLRRRAGRLPTKRARTLLLTAAGLILCAGVTGYLFQTGRLLLNNPPSDRYPIRGVDVSSYQGTIDWDMIRAQNIRFAFVKATEGSSLTDPRFHANYEDATKAGLRVGAYHFFSYDTGGVAQADHFAGVVAKTDNMLPPVIDLEFYGDYAKYPLPKEQVVPQLEAFVQKVKDTYGVSPIIYATQKSYGLYIQGGFADCDIWIRNVYSTPSLPDGRAWTFWQYADKATLKGYAGAETHIDMNVFAGTEAEFEGYGK